ncbi:Protein HflK [Dirofilaria immitis]
MKKESSNAANNDIIPRAKGEAIKIKLDAEAYENEIINEAKGNALEPFNPLIMLLYDSRLRRLKFLIELKNAINDWELRNAM